MKQSKLQSLGMSLPENVDDPVFLQVVRDSGRCKPSQGVVYAPADAEVRIALLLGHAYGFEDSKWSCWNLDPRWYRHGDYERQGFFEQKVVKATRSAGDAPEPLTQTNVAAGLKDNGYRNFNTADYAVSDTKGKRFSCQGWSLKA